MGVDLGTIYVGRYFSNISGGVNHESNYLDDFILTIGFDMDKLAGSDGLSVFLSGLGINGGLPFETLVYYKVLVTLQELINGNFTKHG
jgi:carbohydrate-selective porin OprB